MDADVDQPHAAEPHRKSVDDVLAALQTDARSGLSQAEARLRERSGGKALTTEAPLDVRIYA
jgi:Ca2+-transporting ATPase